MLDAFKKWRIHIAALLILAVWGTIFWVGSALLDKSGILFTPWFMSSHMVKGLLAYEGEDYAKAANEYDLHYQAYNHWINHFKKNVKISVDKKKSIQDDTEDNADQIGSENLAWNNFLGGQYADARKSAEEILQTYPSSVVALYILGRISFDEGNFDEVFSLTDRILKRERDQTDTLILRSAVYARMKKFDLAIESLNRGMRDFNSKYEISSFIIALRTLGELMAYPDEKRPYCLLAHYHRYLRVLDPPHWEKTIQVAEKAIEKNDHPDDAYLSIGIVYYRIGNHQKALENLVKAVSINHQNNIAINWISIIYSERKDLINEYQMIQAVAKTSPEDPFYSIWEANFLRKKLGDYQMAMEILNKAIKAAPEDPKILQEAGLTQYEMGNYEQALDYEHKAESLDSSNPDINYAIGWVEEALGHYENARHEFEKGLSLDPYYTDLHMELGRIYVFQHRLRDAIKEYKTAIYLGQDDIKTTTYVCQLYYEIAEFQYAAKCFEKVLQRDPGNQMAIALMEETRKNIKQEASKK